MTKPAKTRTWLLYVLATIFLACAGVLIYRLIDSASKDTSGGKIVYYDDKDPAVIEGEDYYKAIKRKSFFYDSWSGSHSGGVAEWVMTDVITHNKKYPDEPIQVIFGNVNCGGNTSCITEKKKSLGDFGDYEISYEYNDEGEVYLVHIDGGGDFNFFMIIPMIIIAFVGFFMIFIVIRTIKMGKITKGIIDSVGGKKDEY